MIELLYLLGRDQPMVVTALGWSLMFLGWWGLFAILGARIFPRRRP